MESQEIIEAAKKRLPVVYDGVVYKEILEYILWFDSNRNKQRSVVLLDRVYQGSRPSKQNHPCRKRIEKGERICRKKQRSMYLKSKLQSVSGVGGYSRLSSA